MEIKTAYERGLDEVFPNRKPLSEFVVDLSGVKTEPIVDRTYCSPTYDPAIHDCIICEAAAYQGIKNPDGSPLLCGVCTTRDRLRQVKAGEINLWAAIESGTTVWTDSFMRRG